MLFSSVPFLFYFLPAALLIYFAAPRQLKNAVLLLASLFFYAWGEPKYMLLMLVSIVQGYGFGLLIEKHHGQKASKVFLTLSILVSLGLLGYFKYADFFLSSVNAVTGLSLPLLKLSLPIGISFYTFQVLSYVIDVYRGETAAQRNFIDLAAYVSLFPQLIAGPIVRYSDVAAELKSRTHSVSAAAEGVRRFTVGFAKKILLANQFGALASAYKSTQDASVLFVWLYALAFLLQVYFDFSGYSDMAIGLGRMLGFHFPENFNYPYISASITEFWRRWHMSLGSWFRDYLYIPLGGSRKGKARQLLNILIVWLATGLWQGRRGRSCCGDCGSRSCCFLKSWRCCRCSKSTACSAMCTRSFSSRSASCFSTQTAPRRRSRASARCSAQADCRCRARRRSTTLKAMARCSCSVSSAQHRCRR